MTTGDSAHPSRFCGPLGFDVLDSRGSSRAADHVENYVGRQVPTAMVARNLDRGSGILRPQLETAPFPNYFVVEPPLYESLVVALERWAG